METWLSPEKYRLDGDRLTTRKIVDGSLIEVGAYGVNGQYNNYAAGYPVAGRGVYKNTENGKVLQHLPDEWIRKRDG